MYYQNYSASSRCGFPSSLEPLPYPLTIVLRPSPTAPRHLRHQASYILSYWYIIIIDDVCCVVTSQDRRFDPSPRSFTPLISSATRFLGCQPPMATTRALLLHSEPLSHWATSKSGWTLHARSLIMYIYPRTPNHHHPSIHPSGPWALVTFASPCSPSHSLVQKYFLWDDFILYQPLFLSSFSSYQSFNSLPLIFMRM